MKQLDSLSTVMVIDTPGAIPRLPALADQLATLAADSELVLVAHGLDSAAAAQLHAVAATIADCTLIFLAQPLETEQAQLVGLDHAIGSRVVLTDGQEAALSLLPALLAIDADLVCGPAPLYQPPRLARGLLDIFALLCRRLLGIVVETAPSPLRVLSRAAAVYIAGQPHGELLLRVRDLGPGWRCTTCTGAALPARMRPLRLWRGWRKALRLIIAATGAPLRLASFLSLLAGGASLLYGFYVIGAFLLLPNIEPGWTTLSLQLAGMMFLFSVVFFLLAEYVIQIHTANPGQVRRRWILREVRSALTRNQGILNIEGDPVIGRPAATAS